MVNDHDEREQAMEPNDLGRLLAERGDAGDVEGMVALYEAGAVLAYPPGRLSIGTQTIREAFEYMLATAPTFTPGDQQPALVLGDLALTSTRFPGSGAIAEVARRQPDGSWLWVLDQPNVLGS